jgi:DNA repair ATPase RecN
VTDSVTKREKLRERLRRRRERRKALKAAAKLAEQAANSNGNENVVTADPETQTPREKERERQRAINALERDVEELGRLSPTKEGTAEIERLRHEVEELRRIFRQHQRLATPSTRAPPATPLHRRFHPATF